MKPGAVTKFVGYCRVSTEQQGADGLGIAAQTARVRQMAEGGELLAIHTEVESGAKADRKELAKAIDQARRAKAILLVAKLDRLARDARFLLTIADSGLDVRFGDAPGLDATSSAGRLQLTMLGAFAEFERNRIRERIRDALGEMKARIDRDGYTLTKGDPKRGVAPRRLQRLGNPQIEALAARRKADLQAQAKARAESLATHIREIRHDGINTVRGITQALNERRIPAPKGGRWHVPTVHRVLKRLEA